MDSGSGASVCFGLRGLLTTLISKTHIDSLLETGHTLTASFQTGDDEEGEPECLRWLAVSSRADPFLKTQKIPKSQLSVFFYLLQVYYKLFIRRYQTRIVLTINDRKLLIEGTPKKVF